MTTRTDRTSHGALMAAALLVATLVAAPAAAQAHAGHGMMDHVGDSAAVVSTVERFHAALARGDSAAVMSLLTPGARIVESGGVETREEYTHHHLPADMAFAAAVPRERGPIEVTVRGDVAWAVSTSRSRGTYREREIDSRGAELVVLSRDGGDWRIEAVHWSSRSAG